MKNLDKLDSMDRMLSRLPSEQVPGDLAVRVKGYVRFRRYQRLAGRFGLSLVLAVGGFWLSYPLFFALPSSVNLPGSGVMLFWDWLQLALSNLQVFLTSAWDGFTGLQSGVAAPMTASVVLGLLILALSAMLAVSPLLQQSDRSLRKGR